MPAQPSLRVTRRPCLDLSFIKFLLTLFFTDPTFSPLGNY